MRKAQTNLNKIMKEKMISIEEIDQNSYNAL